MVERHKQMGRIAGCLLLTFGAAPLIPAQQANPALPTTPPAVPGPIMTTPFVATDRLSEPWWAARHLAILIDLMTHPTVDLLFVGDSITQNYEKSNPPDENFQPTWQHFYGDRNALNLGFSGDTTGNVLWRLRHGEIDGLHPRVVVLLIGVNDTDFRRLPAEEAEAGIEADIAELKTRLPLSKILLIGILPSHRSDAVTAANLAINRSSAARYAHDPVVTYLDITPAFTVDGKADGKLNEAIFYDPRLTPPRGALHPDTEGQRRMALAVEPTLSRMLGVAAKK